MWAGNFTLSLRQPTARPNGVLRGGVGSPKGQSKWITLDVTHVGFVFILRTSRISANGGRNLFRRAILGGINSALH